MKAVLPYLGFFLAFRIYHWLTGPLGLPFRTRTFRTEVPIVLAMFATTLLFTKKTRWGLAAAAIPVFFAYGAHDYYLWVLGEVPGWRDFGRVPELVRVVSWSGLVAVIVSVVVPVTLLARQVDVRHLRSPRLGVFVPWVVLAVVASTYPYEIVTWANRALELKQWSKVRNAQFHGRLFMAGLRELEHRHALDHLADDASAIDRLERHISLSELKTFEPRNVHIIVLESFLDATRLSKVRFSRSPMSDEMIALRGETRSVSFSPHPIGGTAESEFEILCGIPALGAYGYQEFKMFTGGATPCLPRTLSSLGYRSRAAHAFLRAMYNRPVAYRSLGFDEARFLSEDSGDGGLERISMSSKYVLDENLYSQLLPWVESQIASGRHVFNYALTMEGHTPHRLDPERQPVVVRVEPYDEVVEVLANKTYYRSRALAKYVRRLVQIDPDGIIVAVSDHLPPIPGRGAFYEEFGLTGNAGPDGASRMRGQFLLVVDRGEVIVPPIRRHFHINQWILDRLANETYCDRRTCFSASDTDANRTAYATVLMRAMGR